MKINRLPLKAAFLFLGVLFLPLGVWLAGRMAVWRPRAGGRLANIIIDQSKSGLMVNSQLWRNFAQGGNAGADDLAAALPVLRQLHPQYVRLDHIFDAYQVYRGPGSFDFSRLDAVVRAILAIGAKPFFSLSYIPSQLSGNGQITAPPADWQAWQNLVQATVEHYSGYRGMNIGNVYYEVYNEPDLFGHWHYGRRPNYLALYRYSARGAMAARAVQPFKIGGPATTAFYPNWIKALLGLCQRQNLRLDFVSWHQYSARSSAYPADFEALNKILSANPRWVGLERIISEFGPESDRSQWYQNRVGAAHDLAAALSLLDRIHRLFAFSIRDVRSEKQGWGLLGGRGSSLQKRPRWFSYQMLNRLRGRRIYLQGEGSWVRGVATRISNRQWQLLLVNYDANGRHAEKVPVRFINFQPGQYQIGYQFLSGRRANKTLRSDGGLLFDAVYLPANEAVLLTINRQ